MTQSTPRAKAPLLAAAQAQKHVTHNEALLQLDALVSARILDRDLSAPPASPADGDAYLVKATGSGAWAGQDGKLAFAVDGAWRFYAPFAGLTAYIADESVILVYTAAGWKDWSSIVNLQSVPLIGVNTAADATNKFAIKSNAALFAALEAANGGNGDMQVKVDKETATDTGSVLFQTNFSGRAEFGLIGDDNWHVKVSPDGAAWTEVMVADRTSGLVTVAGDPVAPLGIATKQYADAAGGSASGGGAFRTVDVVAAANVNLATDLAAGQMLDGQTLVAGWSVLVPAQTTASQNGIYTVPAAGAASRSADANSAAKLSSGLTVVVNRGTIYAHAVWRHITAPGFTLGTTSLVFSLRTVTTTPWSPTDSSGAGLVFANVSAAWSVRDGMLVAQADLTYPANTNGLGAQIGNLPFTVPAPSYNKTTGVITLNSGAPSSDVALALSGTKTLQFIDRATGGGPLNSQASGKRFFFYVSYALD